MAKKSVKKPVFPTGSNLVLQPTSTQVLLHGEANPLSTYEKPGDYVAAQTLMDPSRIVRIAMEEQREKLLTFVEPLKKRLTELDREVTELKESVHKTVRAIAVQHGRQVASRFESAYTETFGSFVYNIRLGHAGVQYSRDEVDVIIDVSSSGSMRLASSFEDSEEWHGIYNRASTSGHTIEIRKTLSLAGSSAYREAKEKLGAVQKTLNENQERLAKLNLDIANLPEYGRRLENEMTRKLLKSSELGEKLLEQIQGIRVETEGYAPA